MPDVLTEAKGVLLERSEEMDRLWKKIDAKTGKHDWSAQDHERFGDLRKEIDEKAAEVRDLEDRKAAADANQARLDSLRAPEKAFRHGNGRPAGDDGAELLPARREAKSIGRLIVESSEFKGRSRGIPLPFEFGEKDLEGLGFDFKTTMTTAAGFAPFTNRSSDVVPYALRKVRLMDILREVQTNDASVVYMEETTHTSAAAVVAEGAAKPESAYAFTQRTVLVEVVATILPVTEQQLMDVPQIRGLIDGMLGEDVARAEESQILTGTGTSPELQGFLTKSGVQTQAKGSDPVPSAIYKAVTLVRWTGYAEPDAVVFHPNDWQDVRLLQDTTGRYIWGDPWVPGPEMIWGIPVVVTSAETENTALVGAFRQYSYVARRMGLRVEVGYINDNFSKNLKTLRAETRLANVIRRPAAYCKVTGI